MIIEMKKWCEEIIIAIIISIIIEALIPEGKNKKYIKVVIGIYIMFVTLNPILELINKDIKLESFFNNKEIETSYTFSEENKRVYIVGIEETIKLEIENMGYEVGKVKVDVDTQYENIEKISLEIIGKKDEIKSIEKIKIGIEKNEIKQYEDISYFLTQNYCVTEEQIIFL